MVEMNADLLNKIYFDYRKELGKAGLNESKATDMFNAIKNSQRETTYTTTTRNLDDSQSEVSITKNKGRSDWLAQNPLMKKSCKKFGIKTSAELRNLIYLYWGEIR